MNVNEFIEGVKKINIIPTKEELEKLKKYVHLLQFWNNKMNLTSIREEKDIYLKHFYDSLTIVKTGIIKNNISIADIGSGAGFPGMIIAIFFNNIKVTLIESNKKKYKFLKIVKEELELYNVEIINERAEIYANKNREKFDIVTCRAVSSLRIISELGAPMIREGGYFLPLKANVDEEIKDARSAFLKLNLKLIEKLEFKLPIEDSIRNILIIKKIGITEKKYPREYKKIIKNPL